MFDSKGVSLWEHTIIDVNKYGKIRETVEKIMADTKDSNAAKEQRIQSYISTQFQTIGANIARKHAALQKKGDN